jgi:hypothetical protein
MWLLRGVARTRWLDDRRADDPVHVAAAARDLILRPGEDGLSLFQVEDEEDGRRVATLLGVHKRSLRGHSDHVDYILVPSNDFVGFGLSVVPVPDPTLGADLSQRHREVKGITDDISTRIATALLQEKRFRLNRINRQDIDRAALDFVAPGE